MPRQKERISGDYKMAAITSAVLGAASLGTSIWQGNKAKGAAREAGRASTTAANEQLDYVRAQNAKFEPFKMAGLQGIQSMMGEAPMSQEEALRLAQESPVYSSIMSSKDRALDTVDARASARGGLRSGNLVSDIFNTSQQIDASAMLGGYQDVRNRDDYERNCAIIDLTAQPDHIKAELDTTIAEAVQKPKNPSVGPHFMKFCGKYNLQKSSDNAQQHTEWLAASYN